MDIALARLGSIGVANLRRPAQDVNHDLRHRRHSVARRPLRLRVALRAGVRGGEGAVIWLALAGFGLFECIGGTGLRLPGRP